MRKMLNIFGEVGRVNTLPARGNSELVMEFPRVGKGGAVREKRDLSFPIFPLVASGPKCV